MKIHTSDDTRFLLAVGTMFAAVIALLLALLFHAAKADDELPPVQTVEADANPTPQQVALGQMLFFDPRLSTTGEKSCASCHQPERGWTDAGPVSQGVRGQFGIRRSMTIEDAVFKANLFHDGRARFAEGQATQPIQAAAEMGNQTLQKAFGRLARIQGYQDEFQGAFGRGVNVTDGIRALAMFERTVVHSRAPIDDYAEGRTYVFDKQQERGNQLFNTMGCGNCHYGKTFSDGDFHVMLGATRDRNGQQDIGRGKITRNRADNFKFVTPTLRDIGKRAPYMHAGQCADMRAVVDLLCDPPRGSEFAGMDLGEDDRQALTRFLMTAFESEHPPFASTPALPQ